jgi:hypothetical protein
MTPSNIVVILTMALGIGLPIDHTKPAPDIESFEEEEGVHSICNGNGSLGCNYLEQLGEADFEKHYDAALHAVRARENDVKEDCTTPDGAATHPCLRRETEHMIYHWMVPPFPTAPVKEAHGYVKTFHPKFGKLLTEWIPVAATAEGEGFLQEIERRARARELFGCIGSSCLRYIVQKANEGALPATQVGGKEHAGPPSTYSLCVVESAGGMMSIPHTCNPVVIFYGGEAWVEAIVGYAKCFDFGPSPPDEKDFSEEGLDLDQRDFGYRDSNESGIGVESVGIVPELAKYGITTYDMGPTPPGAGGRASLERFESWDRALWKPPPPTGSGENIQPDFLNQAVTKVKAEDEFNQKAEREFRYTQCAAMKLKARCVARPPLFGEFGESYGFKSPYPLELMHRAAWDPYFGPPIFAWVPARLAVDGEKSVLRWFSLARASERLDCDDSYCMVFRSVPGQNKQRTLMNICRVPVGTTSAKKEVCYSVATMEDSQPGWVRAIIGFGRPEDSGGGGGVFSTSWIVRGLSLDPMAEVISRAFAAPPYSFAVDRLGTPPVIQLTASQNSRPSPILAHWREFVSVDVFLYDVGPKLTALTMKTTLQVNRQNTDRPQDWHRPSDEQETTYREQITRSMRKALERSCKTARWVNENNLDCR